MQSTHRLFDLTPHADERGSFTEVFRQNWTQEQTGEHSWEEYFFPQANISRSKTGVLRGMHFHKDQFDWWVVLEGEMQVALVDLRNRDTLTKDVLTLGRTPEALLIPPLVAHGFLALTDVVMLYLVSNYHTGKDEFGIAWDDPDMAIPWDPALTDGSVRVHGLPILSERDRSNPSLSAVRNSL